MLFFRATSSAFLTMLDVRSVCILSSTLDQYLEVKVRARDRQYSACLLILCTKVTRILMWLTWVYSVMHNTCIKHGTDIKTQCIGSTSILLLSKGWHSIRLDRMQSFFKKRFQLIVFQKLLEWKLERSFSKKCTCHLGLHQWSPWNTNGKDKWVQNSLNDQKLGSYLEVSSRTNQFFIRFVRERGDPLSRITWSLCQIVLKHVLVMKEKRSTLEMKHFRERMGRSVIDHDDLCHDKQMVNEADMDFRIPRLPHSVVKHAQSTSVRKLIQKIENHPDRHALQQDRRQNQSFNPFSPASKQMIQDVDNIELCELLETEPKT